MAPPQGNLVEEAEKKNPEIKELPAHHGRPIIGENGEDGEDQHVKSGDVQELPESLLHCDNEFIKSGGKKGSLHG